MAMTGGEPLDHGRVPFIGLGKLMIKHSHPRIGWRLGPAPALGRQRPLGLDALC